MMRDGRVELTTTLNPVQKMHRSPNAALALALNSVPRPRVVTNMWLLPV
jgi:hypothetical protein